MSEIVFEMWFPHNYEIEFPTELSGSGRIPQFYYPGGTQDGRPCHLICKVVPAKRSPWFACFDGGYAGVNGLYATPNPDRFCAVSAGDGFLISSEHPERWELIDKVIAIRHVRTAPRAGLLLFADYVGIAAYGSSGLAWHMQGFTPEAMEVFDNEDVIRGRGEDLSWNREANFVVDLKSGRVLESSPIE